MMTKIIIVKLIIFGLLLNCCYCMSVNEEEIVVRILSGPIAARKLANEFGFHYIGPVSSF